jgi:tRNA-specific 2-thiouridylase
MKKSEKNKVRVICAMSGGVDSSVAAALLVKQGYDVIGIFMKLWAEKVDSTDLVRENICCSVEASTAARAVAEKLGIPFYVVNFEKEFKKAVVDYYIEEYESGRTPNPCVICNRDIKGELLMKKGVELGADYLATGHYARIKKVKNGYKFMQAKDKNKDQTYFLWTLAQDKLAHLLLPCGDFTKPEIRRMALEFGLPTATRRESQGICFIPDRNVGGFLRRYAQNLTEPGPIVELKTSEQIGQHDGLINYTIGQREGLGLGGPTAYYVVKLESHSNTLVVGSNEDLFQKELIAVNLNWINPTIGRKLPTAGIGARIRHGHSIEKCRLLIIDDQSVKVIFNKSQRAITPGQSIVFYHGQEVLGGGIIK